MIKNCKVCKKEYKSKASEGRVYCSRLCFFSTLEGIKRSKKIGEKISNSKKGKLNGRLGYKQSEITKQKIREARAKQLPPVPMGFKYEGNITSELHLLRMSLQYRIWRETVFERDNYTCQDCGQRGGKLNADHIESFARVPGKRFNIDNGRTLCELCHRKTSTFGGRSKKGFKMQLKTNTNI